MIRQVLIDFGLSSTAQYAENYAVDLYVLERAFASTHPASEMLYAGVSFTRQHWEDEMAYTAWAGPGSLCQGIGGEEMASHRSQAKRRYVNLSMSPSGANDGLVRLRGRKRDMTG